MQAIEYVTYLGQHVRKAIGESLPHNKYKQKYIRVLVVWEKT